MKKLLFGLLAIIGLFVAVCTEDDCPNEMWFRAGGTAMFALSSYFGGWWDEDNKIINNQKQEEKQ